MLTSGAFDPENILLGFDSLVLSGPDIPSEFSEAMTQRLELARNDSRQVVDVYPSACGKSASPGSTAELLPPTSDHWQQAVRKPAQSLAFDAEGNSRPDRF
jgi:hypothetical protein